MQQLVVLQVTSKLRNLEPRVTYIDLYNYFNFELRVTQNHAFLKYLKVNKSMAEWTIVISFV